MICTRPDCQSTTTERLYHKKRKLHFEKRLAGNEERVGAELDRLPELLRTSRALIIKRQSGPSMCRSQIDVTGALIFDGYRTPNEGAVLTLILPNFGDDLR